MTVDHRAQRHRPHLLVALDALLSESGVTRAAGLGRLMLATRMGECDSTVPAAFAGVAPLGVIGIVFVGFDVFVREKVPRQRALFDREVVQVDPYVRKKERREARLRAKGLVG